MRFIMFTIFLSIIVNHINTQAIQFKISTDSALKKQNLLGMDLETLTAYFLDMGEKSFRAMQIFKWIHQFAENDFSKMTNVSKNLRSNLSEKAEIHIPEVAIEQKAKDGTKKWLLKLDDGNCIETVFIPENNRGLKKTIIFFKRAKNTVKIWISS